MKKLLSLLLVLFIAFSIPGCSKKEQDNKAERVSEKPDNSAELVKSNKAYEDAQKEEEKLNILKRDKPITQLDYYFYTFYLISVTP